MIESYLTQSHSNVTCMQIVRSNNNKGSKTSISCQSNLPLYIAEAKALWKAILSRYVKNWMQKDKIKQIIANRYLCNIRNLDWWNLAHSTGLTHSINQSFWEAESAHEIIQTLLTRNPTYPIIKM